MSLTHDLAHLAAQNRSALPEDLRTVMEQARLNLTRSGAFDRSLQPGNPIPSFVLPNAIGKLVDIQSLLNKGAVVISFYRGRWCPYCSLELLALQQALPEIQACGASLVAISPQTPDHSLETAEAHTLKFEVLSDVGNQVARKFGLVFSVPESVRPIYEKFGIDLQAANGTETFELPLPATYIVKASGTIAHAFVNSDYTQRLDPKDIVKVLKRLQSRPLSLRFKGGEKPALQAYCSPSSSTIT